MSDPWDDQLREAIRRDRRRWALVIAMIVMLGYISLALVEDYCISIEEWAERERLVARHGGGRGFEVEYQKRWKEYQAGRLTFKKLDNWQRSQGWRDSEVVDAELALIDRWVPPPRVHADVRRALRWYPLIALLSTLFGVLPCWMLAGHVVRQLRRKGYGWPTHGDALWLLLRLHARLAMIPHADDYHTIPGSRASATGLIGFVRLRLDVGRGPA